jgi:hypothetical protein
VTSNERIPCCTSNVASFSFRKVASLNASSSFQIFGAFGHHRQKPRCRLLSIVASFTRRKVASYEASRGFSQGMHEVIQCTENIILRVFYELWKPSSENCS